MGKYPNPFEDITDCAAHVTEVDEDCEYCKAELAGKMDVLAKSAKENEKLMERLEKSGAKIPYEFLIAARMELLIEVVFQDPRQRSHFEAESHRRMAETLKEAHQQIMERKLLNDLQVVRKPPLHRK